MKLIKDKSLLQNLAHQLDLLNTISGGVVQPVVQIDKRKRGAIIKVSASALAPETFQVVLHNNALTVFSTFTKEDKPDLALPLFTQVFVLPPQIDLGRIEAVHQDGQLQVRLPYHEAAEEPRIIQIEKL